MRLGATAVQYIAERGVEVVAAAVERAHAARMADAAQAPATIPSARSPRRGRDHPARAAVVGGRRARRDQGRRRRAGRERFPHAAPSAPQGRGGGRGQRGRRRPGAVARGVGGPTGGLRRAARHPRHVLSRDLPGRDRGPRGRRGARGVPGGRPPDQAGAQGEDSAGRGAPPAGPGDLAAPRPAGPRPAPPRAVALALLRGGLAARARPHGRLPRALRRGVDGVGDGRARSRGRPRAGRARVRPVGRPREAPARGDGRGARDPGGGPRSGGAHAPRRRRPRRAARRPRGAGRRGGGRRGGDGVLVVGVRVRRDRRRPAEPRGVRGARGRGGCVPCSGTGRSPSSASGR